MVRLPNNHAEFSCSYHEEDEQQQQHHHDEKRTRIAAASPPSRRYLLISIHLCFCCFCFMLYLSQYSKKQILPTAYQQQQMTTLFLESYHTGSTASDDIGGGGGGADATGDIMTAKESPFLTTGTAGRNGQVIGQHGGTIRNNTSTSAGHPSKKENYTVVVETATTTPTDVITTASNASIYKNSSSFPPRNEGMVVGDREGLSSSDLASQNGIAQNGTYLFIHVGPIKTGTRSIQCNLQANPFLKKSSYEYIGKKERLCSQINHGPLPKKYFNVQSFVLQYILRGWLKQEVHQPYVQKLKKDMKALHDKGKHTIMSGEEFCGVMGLNDELFQLFADLLDSLDQTVRFQVVYRNLFEWTLSSYSFLQWAKVPSDEFQGSSMPSIASHEMIEEYFDVTSPTSQSSCTPHGLWSYFNSKLHLFHKAVYLDVFNMHQGDGDLGTRYICNLPHAKEACEASQRELKFGKSNPTDTDLIHADRIAAAAWEKGLFHNASEVKFKRPQVIQAGKDYVHNKLNLTFTDLPLECLDKLLLNQLLEHSIQHGKEMIGTTFDEDQLREKFKSFIRMKNFCSVNVTAIVLDPDWNYFFQNISISA